MTSISPSSGPAAGGNTITVLGTDFDQVRYVDVGSVAVPLAQMFVTDMGTKIKLKAPSESDGTVDVVVVTLSGQSPPVPADEYTYLGPAVVGVTPSSGPGGGGTKVTITGTNLRGATGVDFGTIPATSFGMNAAKTRITAYAPAQLAGVVDVTVTTPGGVSPTSPPDEFTYLPPAITLARPANGPGDGGTQVKINGADLHDASAVMFGATPAISFTVSGNGRQITAVAPPEAAGTVDITVVTPGGTSAVTAADEYTFLGPTVTKVSPAAGTGNTTVLITGRDLQGATQVEFGGVPAIFVVDPPVNYHPYGTRITATAPTGGSGTVDITVTTPGGTSAASAADEFTYS